MTTSQNESKRALLVRSRVRRYIRFSASSYLCWILVIQLKSRAMVTDKRSKSNFQAVLDLESVKDGDSCSAVVTLVTCYYSTAAKHSESDYAVWNRRFLSLSDSMIIFTERKHLTFIKSVREKSIGCTVVVISSLNDANKRLGVDWHIQAKLDPEASVHRSTDLYVIWNHKSEWVAAAAYQNPFRSTYFFWTDMGQFRDDNFINEYLRPEMTWIKWTNWIPKGKVLFLALEKFDPDELKLESNGKSKPIDSIKVRLGGGNFGGEGEAMIRWAVLFKQKLHDYVSQGAFAGKDQPVYGSLCIERSICHVVDATAVRHISDPWFALQPVLLGIEHPVPIYSWATTSQNP